MIAQRDAIEAVIRPAVAKEATAPKLDDRVAFQCRGSTIGERVSKSRARPALSRIFHRGPHTRTHGTPIHLLIYDAAASPPRGGR